MPSLLRTLLVRNYLKNVNKDRVYDFQIRNKRRIFTDIVSELKVARNEQHPANKLPRTGRKRDPNVQDADSAFCIKNGDLCTYPSPIRRAIGIYLMEQLLEDKMEDYFILLDIETEIQ